MDTMTKIFVFGVVAFITIFIHSIVYNIVSNIAKKTWHKIINSGDGKTKFIILFDLITKKADEKRMNDSIKGILQEQYNIPLIDTDEGKLLVKLFCKMLIAIVYKENIKDVDQFIKNFDMTLLTVIHNIESEDKYFTIILCVSLLTEYLIMNGQNAEAAFISATYAEIVDNSPKGYPAGLYLGKCYQYMLYTKINNPEMFAAKGREWRMIEGLEGKLFQKK